MKKINARVIKGILTIPPTHLPVGEYMFLSKSENIIISNISKFNAHRPLRFATELPDGPVSLVVKTREKVPGTKGYPKNPKEYADRGTTPESYPIDTKEHVHAAISYFGGHGHKFGDSRKTVAERILRAAKKFGIHVSESSDVYKAAHGE